jgi:molybdopterin converting factor subunit 1
VTVHVFYFGLLKEFFDGDRDTVEIPEPATVEHLLQLLHDRGAADLPIWRHVAVAVNREYAQLQTPLHDGDEVALLPPVSGGEDAD